MMQQNLFETEMADASALLPVGPFPRSQKLLALSWKQPYLHLMFHGKIETRTWNTNYRGWVMMCASQTSYKTQSLFNISGTEQFYRIGDTLKGQEAEIYALRGKALGIGFLSDFRPMQKADEDACFVEFHPDLFCHVYKNVQRIEPINWKGAQGWLIVQDDVKDLIRARR